MHDFVVTQESKFCLCFLLVTHNCCLLVIDNSNFEQNYLAVDKHHLKLSTDNVNLIYDVFFLAKATTLAIDSLNNPLEKYIRETNISCYAK